MLIIEIMIFLRMIVVTDDVNNNNNGNNSNSNSNNKYQMVLTIQRQIMVQRATI